MSALARCENVADKIFGPECIFGLDWTVLQIRPWVFDDDRPVHPGSLYVSRATCRLVDVASIQKAYEEIVDDLTSSKRRCLFRDTAAANDRI